MSAASFGTRFIEEIRRVTRSTWGMEYAQVRRLAAMDREQAWAVLAPALDVYGRAWVEQHRKDEPEALVAALLAEGPRLTDEAARTQQKIDVALGATWILSSLLE